MSRFLALLEPIAVMAFGALLGLVDQTATETSGALRVPALIASLLLVAQAIYEFQLRKDLWLRPAATPVLDVLPLTPGAEIVIVESDPPGKASHRTAPGAVKAGGVAAARDDRRIIFGVMGLSVWLGLATLANPGAPWPLLVLSLLAAFLCFSEAWKMLRSRS